MASKRKQQLLKKSRFYLLFPSITMSVFLVIAIGLFIGFSVSGQRVYIILLSVFFVLFIAFYIFISLKIMKLINSTYYEQLYRNTYNNMKKLASNNADLEVYTDTQIQEIDELNQATIELKKRFSSGYLVAREPDYSTLKLKYVDESKHLITFDSFRANLSNIIFLSQSFRNVVVEVYYNLPRGILSSSDKKRVLDLYFNAFSDYEKTLFMFGEDDKSLIIYIPVIDSFSKVKEQLELTSADSSIVTRDVRGIENVVARYALVAYPYSGEEYILSDLRYARRQNLPYNLFLPNRVSNNIGQSKLVNTSMNINYMSKLLSKITSLDYTESVESNNEALENLLTEIMKFMDIDEAGIISIDKDTLNYCSYIVGEGSTMFKGNNKIDPEFINVLNTNADNDGSYYFSSRRNANTLLGRQLDYYGIRSGYYHVVKNLDGNVTTVIYFFNRNKDFFIDSYMRESFYVVSLRIAHYFEKKALLEQIDYHNLECEYVLSMSDHYLYKVDDNFGLVYLSNDLKKKYPGATKGEKCYKALYGRENICHDCPNKTFKKKIVTLGKSKYEVSLALNDRKTHQRSLFLSKISNEEAKNSSDLFDKDYLIYSYTSLYDSLKNEYVSNGRGYVLLLSIDNSEDFLSNQGSEGFLFAVRRFITKIKSKLKTNDVYLYNPTTIAVMFPFVGHADVITKCETIYELSKEHAFDDGSNDQFKITYLPLGYPRGFAYADDFMKHMSDFYRSGKYEKGKDFIYFSDYSISRSASKREFMISVIESEFSGHNSTSVNLQPIVRISDNHILGAEILLRIADAHRNVFFNALEISRIAEQENKTPIITESIINFVGNMYKDYGKNVFKINDFTRIAINIDQTYLRDPSLIKNVIKLCEENNLPNNFLSFEIPEDMIPDNIDKVKSFAKELSNYHIFFSVDRFTGAYIGSEKLKELGFNEIKIDRSLITKIDKDPIQLKAVSEIIENAHKVGITVGAVGVENEAQCKALKELDNNMVVQGYLFYKPLTRSDLISAIISYDK